MKFTGTVGFEDKETSSESFDVTMSYTDSVFTVRRSGGEVVFVFVPDAELEVFVSNVADINDAYQEWAFPGTILSKGESLEFLLPTATLFDSRASEYLLRSFEDGSMGARPGN